MTEMEYKGDPAPVFLKEGPRQERKCSDLIVFILLLAGIIYYFVVFIMMQQSKIPYS